MPDGAVKNCNPVLSGQREHNGEHHALQAGSFYTWMIEEAQDGTLKHADADS